MRVALDTVRAREGIHYHCPGCHSYAATIPQIRRLGGDKFATSLIRQINTNMTPSERSCPFCGGRMRSFTSQSPAIELDGCRRCCAVWYDVGEFELMPEGAVSGTNEATMSAIEGLALARLAKLKTESGNKDDPDAEWKTIPAIFGLPVETDTVQLARSPYATWMLAMIIVAASIAALSDLSGFIANYGFIPAEAFRHGGATWLTSFFLHGGIIHLLGNLYFLLIFGDNVEDHLGKWRYALLILTATLVGDAVHFMEGPNSSIPCVGASGGISGVIMFYALKFPRAQLSFLWRGGRYYSSYSWFCDWVQIPAWFAIVLWVGLQLIFVGSQLSGFTNVAATAHLGGAIAGFVMWIIWRNHASG